MPRRGAPLACGVDGGCRVEGCGFVSFGVDAVRARRRQLLACRPQRVARRAKREQFVFADSAEGGGAGLTVLHGVVVKDLRSGRGEEDALSAVPANQLRERCSVGT